MVVKPSEPFGAWTLEALGGLNRLYSPGYAEKEDIKQVVSNTKTSVDNAEYLGPRRLLLVAPILFWNFLPAESSLDQIVLHFVAICQAKKRRSMCDLRRQP